MTTAEAIASPDRHSRPGVPRDIIRSATGPLLAVVAGLACWYVASLAAGPARVPSPVAVLADLGTDRVLLTENLTATLATAVIGYVVGNAVAIVVGLLVSALPRPGRAPATAVIVVFYNLPVIAVAPLLQVLLPGAGPRIATAAISVFFPTLLGTLAGLRASDPAALDLARSLGAAKWRTLVRIRLRYAAPDILAGLAVAVPFALIGAMVGEFLGGVDQGLGILLVASMQALNSARVWAIAVIIAVLGGAGMALATMLSRLLLPYGSARSATGVESNPAPLGFPRGAMTFVVTVMLLLGLWIGLVRGLGLPPYLARTPADVWHYLTQGTHFASLASALGVTVARALLGAAIGLAVGTAVAIAVERNATVRAALMPFVLALNSVPYLALVPILAVAIGRGPQTTVTLAVITGLLPTVTMVRAGMQNTPASYGDVAKASGGKAIRQLWLITLPSLVPSLFVALRQVVPFALYAVLVGEFLATDDGIGGLVVDDAINGSYDAAWSGCILITAVAAGLYFIAARLEHLALTRIAPERA